MTALFAFFSGLALGLAWGLQRARAQALREAAQRMRQLLDEADEYQRSLGR
jgi:hypothetical protein